MRLFGKDIFATKTTRQNKMPFLFLDHVPEQQQKQKWKRNIPLENSVCIVSFLINKQANIDSV